MNEYELKELAASARAVQVLIGIAIIVVALTTGGTFRTEVSYDLNPAGSTGTYFEQDLGASHWLLGTIQGTQPDLNAVMKQHVGPGEQINSLSVSTRYSFTDILAGVFSLGIYTPQTVVVKGSVGQAALADAPGSMNEAQLSRLPPGIRAKVLADLAEAGRFAIPSQNR